MSGGSLNYLCYTDPTALVERIHEMEEVEQVLLGYGAEDIAKDVLRLIEFLRSFERSVTFWAERLHTIFRAVEWRLSGDSGDDSVKKAIEEYRKGERNT